jgi:hypothetical protein
VIRPPSLRMQQLKHIPEGVERICQLAISGDELRRIPLLRGWVNKGRKRGLGLLGAPAHRSRIGYFRLATLLRLGQLVLDVVLDPSGARRPLLLGGGLLAGGSPASALPSGLGQLVPDVVLGPPRSPLDAQVRSYCSPLLFWGSPPRC